VWHTANNLPGRRTLEAKVDRLSTSINSSASYWNPRNDNRMNRQTTCLFLHANGGRSNEQPWSSKIPLVQKKQMQS
jgi:hypothetical protein